MRRTPRGWLAALLLLAAGCGTGGGSDAAAPPPARSAAVPTIAVAARAPLPPAADRMTIVVTSAAGIDAPGLDAAVTVLLQRPDAEVVTVAPEAPGSSGVGTGDRAALLDGRTASGHPARVVRASAADAVAAVLDTLPREPDLVVIGVEEGAAVGDGVATSPSIRAARAASSRGVPALVVAADDANGTDFAAAGLFLNQILDFGLDEMPGDAVTVLSVPSCDGGTVRGPLRVDHDASVASGAARCTGPAATPATDVDAHEAGYASVAELR